MNWAYSSLLLSVCINTHLRVTFFDRENSVEKTLPLLGFGPYMVLKPSANVRDLYGKP